MGAAPPPLPTGAAAPEASPSILAADAFSAPPPLPAGAAAGPGVSPPFPPSAAPPPLPAGAAAPEASPSILAADAFSAPPPLPAGAAPPQLLVGAIGGALSPPSVLSPAL